MQSLALSNSFDPNNLGSLASLLDSNAHNAKEALRLLIHKKSQEVALLQEAYEASTRQTTPAGENAPFFFGEEYPDRLPPIFDSPALDGRMMTLPLPVSHRHVMEGISIPVPPSAFQTPQGSPLPSPYMSPTREPLKAGRVPPIIMEKFHLNDKSDFKHIIYNLLVDSFNYPNDPEHNFIQHYEVQRDGVQRIGFRFVNEETTDKKLAQLYCFHAKRVNLEHHSLENVLVQDLYKFYLRNCLELLAKYFEKTKEDKYTFLYTDGHILFVPGGSLDQAAKRIRNMKTRARRLPEKDQRKRKLQKRK